MNISETSLPDVVTIEPVKRGDHRGYFSEVYRQDILNEYLRTDIVFCQDNESSSQKGVLRGLHYQLDPYAQSKLVRVVRGEVLDVAVDIRKGSPTFGEHVSVILSSENMKQLFIPRGFAHGFLVLSDSAVFCYKVDNYYSRDHERGIRYDDPDLGIDWLLDGSQIKVSEKDENMPAFSDADVFDYSKQLYG